MGFNFSFSHFHFFNNLFLKSFYLIFFCLNKQKKIKQNKYNQFFFRIIDLRILVVFIFLKQGKIFFLYIIENTKKHEIRFRLLIVLDSFFKINYVNFEHESKSTSNQEKKIKFNITIITIISVIVIFWETQSGVINLKITRIT